MIECDSKIEAHLQNFESKSINTNTPPKNKGDKKRKNQLNFDLNQEIYQITGVDLSKVAGFDGNIIMRIISETGTELTAWPTVKHFTSWLCLCPGNKITGGKILSTKTNSSSNRAAHTFRLAANGLHNSKSAIGAFLRRKKAQLGAPKAITATAHKLARIFYSLLTNKSEFKDQGSQY